ncbi:hypothetical protein DFQ28_004213 [Apophysomyces sp. BC1034]|nr:hypothetical protein DFQ30_004193 [Apophysomyces sp. BC1015]KAG0178543.1 hypothetical protein DFQ29_003326 [Apophysomyces sp. BC1021]KAG0188871.1 hypothetical protein DFQ28_004213 [Apophysomyces sp. BC1034]
MSQPDYLFVYGDSYSASKEQQTDGPLWSEQLAKAWGLELKSLAVAGASICPSPDTTKSDLSKQWKAAVSEATSSTEKNIHAIFAGITDIVESKQFDTDTLLKCIKQQIASIEQSDLHGDIILLGVPPLEFSPFYQKNTYQSTIKQRVMNLNTALEDLSNDDPKVTFFDTYSLFGDVLGNPSEFDIRNVDQAYWDACQGQCLDSVDSYLWWDKIHMTGAGHKAMANGIVAKNQSQRPVEPVETVETVEQGTASNTVADSDHLRYASWLLLFGIIIGITIFVMRPGSQFRRWLNKPRHYSAV